MKIYLASSSLRRIEYLKNWGFDFEVARSKVEEKILDNNPVGTVLTNAYLKAIKVYKKYKNQVIVGMDTVVEINNIILGKPANKQDNVKMLMKLSDKEHRVITGICVINESVIGLDYVETAVSFRKILIKEAKMYAETGEGLDKAGGYAIQGLASDFVIDVKGLLDNVIGVPVVSLRNLLYKIIEIS